MMDVHPILTGLLILSLIFLVISIARYTLLKQTYLKNETEFHRITFENRNKTTEYSTQILELIRTIVAQVAIIKYRNFREMNDMNKITEAMIKNLIRDIAETTHKSLNLDNVMWDDAMFNREFIESYIIEMTILLVKESVHKTIMEENV